MATRRTIVALTALLLATSMLAASCGDPGGGGKAAALRATRRFASRYLRPDGRVATGGGGAATYSEGEGYAMLLEVASGDRGRFAQAWHWSEKHLMQPDGLLAWDWQAGRVVNADSASDADLDIATALVLAGRRWPGQGYRSAGIRYAAAILARETVQVGGQTWLVAGPWALTPPYYVDLSYFDPAAYAVLGRATGNPRWKALASSSVAALEEDTSGGTKLPSDWATLGSSGFATPAPPKGGSSVVYGYDAFRVLVRQADTCSTSRGTRLDARLLPLARGSGDGGGAYTQSGKVAEAGGPNPLYLVAIAGAAKAAGRTSLTHRYLEEATREAAAHPSYYLDAWVALGWWMLTTSRLAGCAA